MYNDDLGFEIVLYVCMYVCMYVEQRFLWNQDMLRLLFYVLCLSVYLSIYPSLLLFYVLCLSVYPSIHPSIHPSI